MRSSSTRRKNTSRNSFKFDLQLPSARTQWPARRAPFVVTELIVHDSKLHLCVGRLKIKGPRQDRPECQRMSGEPRDGVKSKTGGCKCSLMKPAISWLPLF